MNEGLTNLETVKSIQTLIDMCFQSNAILDNIVYQLDISPINVPKLYEFTHYTLSHSFPTTFADTITDFMLQQNDRIYRGVLQGANKNYNSIIECYQDIVNTYVNVQKQVEICIDIAIENKDKAVEDFLRDFNVKVATLYVKQAKVLLNGIKQYNDEGLLSLINSNFEDFVIIK